MRRFLLISAMLLPLAFAAPASADQLLGVSSHALWSSVSPADSARELDKMQAAGSNVVRLDLGWTTLQLDGPQNDSGALQRVDAFMASARSRGMKVILTLWGTPCWASSAPDSIKQNCAGRWWERDVSRYAPTDPVAYANAAASAVQRWSADLAAFEVWNEPDDPSFWNGDAAGYARLVNATYPRVKAVAPSVPVLAASLSGADEPWLQGMYAAGMGGNFDGLAVHLYTGANDPVLAAPTIAKRWSLGTGLDAMRAILASHGDAGKGIWVTELGYSTCINGDHICVSESTQAEYLGRAVDILRRQSDVRNITVYQIRDTGDNTDDRYGLLTSDFREKPAFAAMKAAFAGTGASTPPATTVSQPAAASTSPTPVAKPPVTKSTKRAPLRLTVTRIGGRVVVRGSGAPSRSKVHLRVRIRHAGRGARSAKVLVVRATRAGRFRVVLFAQRSARVQIVASVH
jgi:hypothetical protein